MTGLELLREEMRKRGATQAQAESKLVPMVLDIVANSGTAYTDTAKAFEDLERLERQIKCRMPTIEMARAELDGARAKLDEDREAFEAEKTQFAENLAGLETPESRDEMRKAMYFKANCNVETEYDNYAYIAGLAAILSNGAGVMPDKRQREANA